MKNKIIAAFLSIFMLAGLFSGCSSPALTADDRLSIVCTTFPQYDWTRQILGEKTSDVKLTLLIDNGVDLHNYQPDADDIIAISECDIFIYVGGESDGWVDDVLSKAKNKDMRVISLMDTLGSSVKEEEIVEGMEEGHEHEEDEHHEEHHEEEPEYDEHVWLSVKNAKTVCTAISDALCEADSANASTYKANAAAYTEKLDELDGKYSDAVSSAKRNTVLFGDRFPFRYLTDDYGIEYYAAFVGCSAETEADFETIIFLADKTDELALPVIFYLDGSDGAIAKSIADNVSGTAPELLVMNAMQSVTEKDIENGTTYLSVMEDNLVALKKALN